MNILTSIISILVGGGILAFIQFLITRHDSKHDRFKGITDAIKALSDKVDAMGAKSDERYAVTARVRILRFADEMLEGRKHTKDSWDQVMGADITDYEAYCETHPTFRNNKTEATVAFIKEGYAERLKKNDFL